MFKFFDPCTEVGLKILLSNRGVIESDLSSDVTFSSMLPQLSRF